MGFYRLVVEVAMNDMFSKLDAAINRLQEEYGAAIKGIPEACPAAIKGVFEDTLQNHEAAIKGVMKEHETAIKRILEDKGMPQEEYEAMIDDILEELEEFEAAFMTHLSNKYLLSLLCHTVAERMKEAIRRRFHGKSN